jgi:Tfp pilus assembly protein PilP
MSLADRIRRCLSPRRSTIRLSLLLCIGLSWVGSHAQDAAAPAETAPGPGIPFEAPPKELDSRVAEEREAARVLERVTEAARTTRDPFKRFPNDDSDQSVPELERHAAEKYRLVGLIRGMPRLRAMVASPSGKTHFVAEGMRVGNRKGRVLRIRDGELVIREKVINPLGEEEAVDIRLMLNPEEDLAGWR